MSDETSLDLERGDDEEADRIAREGTERSRRVRANQNRSSGGSGGGRSSSKSGGGKGGGRTDTDLASRLSAAFDRLADQREARGDEELAAAIRDDKEAMSRGLVSLTRTVKFLRMPLLMFLSFLEPILAFWHVGGILGRRLLERRQRVMEERAAAQAEYDAATAAAEGAIAA